jgi:restriction system protein
MALPDYQTLMLPILKRLKADGEVAAPALRDQLAEEFSLSNDEVEQLLPSGKQTALANRVGWALTYLRQAKVIESPKRGHYQVTNRGSEILLGNPEKVTTQYLMRYPEFVAFREGNNPSENPADTKGAPEASITLTPDEQIRQGYGRLKDSLAAELLEKILGASPSFFEHLVVDLLLAMGYGGSKEDAASIVGKSGDGGIDGIIKEDRLGLDCIYVQAKRYADKPVGRPDVQGFAGALQGKRARKGIFITTSKFTADAKGYVESLPTTIVLIDGVQLAQLMIEHGVGVGETGVFKILKLDEDYFIEE